MSAQLTAQPPLLNETLLKLLDELSGECRNTLRLLGQLEVSRLTPDQLGDILGELSGAVAHLHVHSQGLQDLIGDELERLD